jgi:hypothetical protein
MKPRLALVTFIVLVSFCGACGGGGGNSTPVPTAKPTTAPTAAPTTAPTSGPTATPSSTPTPAASGSNEQPIEVNSGPQGNYTNGLFTSITVCVPGTTDCQTIPDVLVDTGSYGLRILGSALTISLPGQTSGGNAVAECAFFVDSFTWGPVATADVEMAGEVANNVPVQIVGEPGFLSPPLACTNGGLSPADTLEALGANGLLGVGPLIQDCGSACASGSASTAEYFVCTSSTCSATSQSLATQVQNPIALFSQDNNGLAVSLPAIGADGAPTASGSLIFGIGTQSNNGLGSATVYTLNSLGEFTTTYGGVSYDSLLDTGSNALFFLTPGVTGIPECSGETAGLYCPTSTLSLSAQNVGINGASGTVTFNIANADSLFSTSNFAFNNLGGISSDFFDWGLPFFFGRQVFVAIEAQQTPSGPGPYFAY